MQIVSLTPANNEEIALPGVLLALRSVRVGEFSLDRMLVVDNASTDETARVAEKYGAVVLHERDRGYGAACLRGISALGDADIVVFVDGDGSDYAEEWPSLVAPIVNDKADLVVGVRSAANAEPGALSVHQRFGNWLALSLVHLIWGKRLSDLGPFRAIRVSALRELQMKDKDFGWTIEMQIKALLVGLRITEVPVRYRRRQGGVSKVSGSLMGSLLAGKKIISIILREAFSRRECLVQ